MRQLVAVLVVVLGLAATPLSEARGRTAMAGISEADETFFWAIMDRTAQFAGDEDQQVTALRSELEKLDPLQIERFGLIFNTVLHRSYAWDLWGAAYVGREVWTTKTGREPDSEIVQPDMIYRDSSPSGTPFSEEGRSPSKRYPALWKRFGHAPLG